MARGEAEEVDNLGGEEGDEAEFGSVIEGEDDVGDAGGEHGSEQEVVFWEDFGDVEEAEGDAADTEEGEKVAVRGEKAEGDIDEEEGAPDDGPEEAAEMGDFCQLCGVRMDTIRSRNYCSYFTFV